MAARKRSVNGVGSNQYKTRPGLGSAAPAARVAAFATEPAAGACGTCGEVVDGDACGACGTLHDAPRTEPEPGPARLTIPRDDPFLNDDLVRCRRNPARFWSHLGLVRNGNEDRAYIERTHWGVADGMGGHGDGELASYAAITAAQQVLNEDGFNGLSLRNAIAAAHEACVPLGSGREAPGSTLVLAGIHDDKDRILIGWVGDSRAYAINPDADDDWDGLRQLTTDHSMRDTFTSREVLTRCLGSSAAPGESDPDTVEYRPAPGDRYLLICTDGLHGYVPHGKIAAAIRKGAAAGDPACCEDCRRQATAGVQYELVQAALDAGGRDNVTVLLVDLADAGFTT